MAELNLTIWPNGRSWHAPLRWCAFRLHVDASVAGCDESFLLDVAESRCAGGGADLDDGVRCTRLWMARDEGIDGCIGEGWQLFWSAIALCAAGTYEAITALENGSSEASTLALGIAGFCGLAFVCSIVVTACLLSVRHGRPCAIGGDGRTEFPGGTFSRVAIGISIFMSCFVAFLFASLHIHLN